jgi:hypothetical protein
MVSSYRRLGEPDRSEQLAQVRGTKTTGWERSLHASSRGMQGTTRRRRRPDAQTWQARTRCPQQLAACPVASTLPIVITHCAVVVEQSSARCPTYRCSAAKARGSAKRDRRLRPLQHLVGQLAPPEPDDCCCQEYGECDRQGKFALHHDEFCERENGEPERNRRQQASTWP